MRTIRRMYKNGELASTIRYIWDGDVLLGTRMESVDSDETFLARYLYDDSGELYGMEYKGLENAGSGMFAFIKNLQGDIVSITPLDSESNVEVNMEYDAWGKPIIQQASSMTEGLLMAIMMMVTNVGYRGYFYDLETELYYLRSRYYDPEIGRFINADDTEQLKVPSELTCGISNEVLIINMFAYCGNNPIVRFDYSGNASSLLRGLYPFFLVIDIVNTFCENGLLKVDSTKWTKYLGHIAVDFETNVKGYFIYDFLDIIISNYTLSNLAFGLITINLRNLFVETFGRQFLFSEKCIANEIYAHFVGFMWSIRRKGYNLPYYMLGYCLYHKNFKISDMRNQIYYACKEADIYEKDVYDNPGEAKVYDYYNGINDVYKNTNKDPYYYPADNKRKNKFNPKWNKNYFLLK